MLVPEDNEISKKTLGRNFSQRIPFLKELEGRSEIDLDGVRKIKCVCMVGVSPADASVSYKRNRFRDILIESNMRID